MGKLWNIYAIEILLRHKEQNLANCDMFWSWGYYAKWSKSDTERQILYDFAYM